MLPIERTFFVRRVAKDGALVVPIEAAGTVDPGDEEEVRLTVRASAAVESGQIRDPRPSDVEPENALSGCRYDGGLL